MMLKKITFGLIAVLGTASALAGHANDMTLPTASGVNLMAPHQEGSWSFGLQANYFEPNSDFNYVKTTNTTSTSALTTNEYDTRSVDSDYEFGWGADVSYHFPGNGRDVTLAFTQLNSSESNSSVDTKGKLYQPRSTISTAYSDASGKVKVDYDAADLTFGQVITAGNRITLHPFAGLRYAYIDYKATGVYGHQSEHVNGNGNGNVQVDTVTLESDFQGIGPRLGSDAMVNLGNGFSLKGTLGVSLLIGNVDVNEDEYFYTNTSKGSDTHNAYDVDTNTRVVPEADAKLSAMYTVDMNDGYSLGFEAGWQVTNYFDAIQNNFASTQDSSTQYTSYFNQGPFARVQLDVA